MQVIPSAMNAILLSRSQAGASGYITSVTVQAPGEYPVELDGIQGISLDRSAQTDADGFSITCELADNDWGRWLWACVPDALVTIRQGYGAEMLTTFTGFLDMPDEPRDPQERTITLTGRDWMKHAIVQSAIVTAPQGATESGAVLDPSNFVYVNMEVSDIVADLLTHLSFPGTVVAQTSYLVAEFTVTDGTSFAAALSQLASMVAFRSFCDELGTYHFEPPRVTRDAYGTIVPDAQFRAGGPDAWVFPGAYDIETLERATDDLEMYTRVKAVGPMATTALTDAWTQTWVSDLVPKPTGAFYDPAYPDMLRVVSGSTRKIYALNQYDLSVLYGSSNPIPGTLYPAGLSGDPADSSVLWVLDAPWRVGSGSPCSILKLRKSTYAVLATYILPDGEWADIKADGSVLWLANQTTGLFHSRSKANGSSIASYGPHYTGVVTETRTDPSGAAVSGSSMFLFFSGLAQTWRVSTSSPTVVLQVISTAGTGMIGGEMDTTTGTDMYATTDQTSGTVWKYALKVVVPGSQSVWAVAIAGVGLADPEPTVPTGPVEASLSNPIRRLILQLPDISNPSQAAETAQNQLASVGSFRCVMTARIMGNPAVSKCDVVEVIDQVMGEDNLWNIDTHRSDMSDAGYSSTLGLTYVGHVWRGCD